MSDIVDDIDEWLAKTLPAPPKSTLAQRARDEILALRNLACAVLLFHRGGPWTDADRQMWLALTGTEEATTKTLCDFARRGKAHALKDKAHD